MRRVSVGEAGSFVGAAAAVGAAALLGRSCPIRCGNCTQCVTSAGTLAAAAAAVGGALTISLGLKQLNSPK